MSNNFVLSLLQIKHQLFHLCHTYFRVLYEMHSATFLQQLSNIRGYKNLRTANNTLHNRLHVFKYSLYFCYFYDTRKISN